jgi:BclB C-terminal domain-containing protein
MAIDPLGILDRGSAIGFGFAVNGLDISGGEIDTSGINQSVAFSVPRDGEITAVAASFTTTVGITLAGVALTIRAQLYSADPDDNVFTPIQGAFTDLTPPLTGIVTAGTVFSGLTTGLAIPVTEGTRLMMVLELYVSSGTLPISATVTETANASIDKPKPSKNTDTRSKTITRLIYFIYSV